MFKEIIRSSIYNHYNSQEIPLTLGVVETRKLYGLRIVHHGGQPGMHIGSTSGIRLSCHELYALTEAHRTGLLLLEDRRHRFGNFFLKIRRHHHLFFPFLFFLNITDITVVQSS